MKTRVGNLSWPQVAHAFLAPGFRFAGMISKTWGILVLWPVYDS